MCSTKEEHRAPYTKVRIVTPVSKCLIFNKASGLRPATLWKKRLRHKCFPVKFATFLRTSPDNRCYLWKELQMACIVEVLYDIEGSVIWQYSKKRPLLTKFSTIIVQINAFGVFMIFLQSALRRQLWITSLFLGLHDTDVSGCSNMKLQNIFLD